MDNTIWLEKYRPQTLADVIGNEQILIRLMVLCQEKNIPNMILSGPPGCGKTTSAKIISQQVNIPLVYMPLEAIMSKYYGESEQKLASIFEAA